MVKLKLTDLQRVLSQCPLVAQAGLTTIQVKVMRDGKKDKFWGTSIKRFLQLVDKDGTRGTSCVEGVIYLNFRDIKNDQELIKAAAHETAHLLGDSSECVTHAPEIAKYLCAALGLKWNKKAKYN